MSEPIILIDVNPIAHRETVAFVTRSDGSGGNEDVSMPVYPETDS